MPIAQVVAVTSGTVFTNKRVTRAAGWTLSAVEVGFIAQVIEASGDQWAGIIDTVNDGSNYIEVKGWVKGGFSGRGQAAAKPADGSEVRIHKIDGCKSLLIDALDANSQEVFLGFDSGVTIGGGAKPGHPISPTASQPNARVTVGPGLTDYLDLFNVYVIAASSQEVSWIAM